MRLAFSTNLLSHWRQSNLVPSWIDRICANRLLFCLNYLLHWLQVYLTPSWIVLICRRRVLFEWNFLLQCLHVNLSSSWSDWICLIRLAFFLLFTSFGKYCLTSILYTFTKLFSLIGTIFRWFLLLKCSAMSMVRGYLVFSASPKKYVDIEIL